MIPEPSVAQVRWRISRALAGVVLVSVFLSSAPAQVPAAPPTPSSATTSASATPPPLASPPTPLSIPDLVKNYRNSLVLVTGATGAGSGFIANFGGVNFIVTNAHVAAEARGASLKTLDGTALAAGAPSVAVGHDIFRIQITPGGKAFEIMPKVDENASIGDEIVVLGNAEGAGVVNTIPGKIVGLGPNLVEVDAPFVPGNSGSPIVHLKTGKVIGVATYLMIKNFDATTNQAFRTPVVRRFGFRIDSVKVWQPVNWREFFAEAASIHDIDHLTEDLGAFLMDLAKNHHVTPGKHNNPVIKNRIDAWTAQRTRRLSPADAMANDENFLSFLKTACQSDVLAARRQLTYDYFQHQLAEQQQARNEIAGIFDRTIKDIQSSR